MTLALLADLAQVLAEVFIEPEADLREGLGWLLESDPGHALAEPLRRMAEQALPPAEQAVEYARLFLHAKTASPVHLFQSVQSRGHHMAPEVLGSLRSIYDEADIRLAEDLTIPPDHLGLQLACLSFLLGQVLECPQDERGRVADLARRLLRDHLRPLAAAVAEQLPSRAPRPWFQSAVGLTSLLLAESEKALAQI